MDQGLSMARGRAIGESATHKEAPGTGSPGGSKPRDTWETAMRRFTIVMMSLALALGVWSCAAPQRNGPAVIIYLADVAISSFEKCTQEGPCYPRP